MTIQFPLDSFFAANPAVSETAMDADFNGRVDVKDTSVFLYILFGGVRFVQPPEMVVTADQGDGNSTCRMAIRVRVEQSSADGTYASDPSRAQRTRIVMLFTGDLGVGVQLQALDWGGNGSFVSLSSVASAGRSMGYVLATSEQGSGIYTVESSSLLGADFGVSVIQIVETASGWAVPFGGQYISVGNPYPVAGQTENLDNNLAAQFTVQGAGVGFRYDASFAPFASLYISPTHVECVTETPSTTPTAVPTQAPSATPSDAPTAGPSHSPSATPSMGPSSAPTDTPSKAPSDVPSRMPTAAPSSSPSGTPSDAPSTVPSIAPTDAPSTRPSDAPSDVPTDFPSLVPSTFLSASPSRVAADASSASPSLIPTEVPTNVLMSDADVVNENDTTLEFGSQDGEGVLFLGLQKASAISAVSGAAVFGTLIVILILVFLRRRRDSEDRRGKLRAKDLRWSHEWKVGDTDSRKHDAEDEPDYDSARNVLSQKARKSARQVQRQKLSRNQMSVGRRVVQPNWSKVTDEPQERNLMWDDSGLNMQNQNLMSSKMAFPRESSRSNRTINLVHMDSQYEDGEYNDVGGLRPSTMCSPEGFMDDGQFDPTSICYDDETYMRVDTEASRLRKLMAADDGEYLASGGSGGISNIHYLCDLGPHQDGNYRDVDGDCAAIEIAGDSVDADLHSGVFDTASWISGRSKSSGAGALASLTSLPQDPTEFLRALDVDSPDAQASTNSMDLAQFAPAPKRGLGDMKTPARGLPEGINLNRRGLPEGVQVSLQTFPDEIQQDNVNLNAEDREEVLEDYMATSAASAPFMGTRSLTPTGEPKPRIRQPPPVQLAPYDDSGTRPALSPGLFSPPQRSNWGMSPTTPLLLKTPTGGTTGRIAPTVDKSVLFNSVEPCQDTADEVAQQCAVIADTEGAHGDYFANDPVLVFTAAQPATGGTHMQETLPVHEGARASPEGFESE
eukprot:m.300148 g.300148  ORF g.300148 m.300148 type:complete len:959 (+) comp20125_c0_seq9:4449-7325(+)